MKIERSNLNGMWAGVAASMADMTGDEGDPQDLHVEAETTLPMPKVEDPPPAAPIKPREIAATLANAGLNLPATRLAAHLAEAPVHLM